MRKEEYYVIANDEGSMIGGYDTLQEAKEALSRHTQFNHVEKVFTTYQEVYRQESEE